MALQTIASWNYFNGSNAVVRMGETVIGEAVAVRYALIQNRTPLYGYNAPLFNAVADGQVIVQGTLAVNYVTHEYLLAAIKSQVDPGIRELFKPPTSPNLDEEEAIAMNGEQMNSALLSGDQGVRIAALKKEFWGKTSRAVTSDYNINIQPKGVFGRPDQHNTSIDITVEIGDPANLNSTKHIIKHVFFTGRSMETAITEDPLVEQFDFIARSIV